jgi:Domain of unknown function (DUF1816)
LFTNYQRAIMEKLAVGTLCVEQGNWWLEVMTDEPYSYLFGPFDKTEEANCKSREYFEDLESEGWQIVSIKIAQREPGIVSEEIGKDLLLLENFGNI